MRPTALNILLADDDDDDRLFFKAAFEEVKLKHTVTEFNDGAQLTDYLGNSGNPVPDIIFLDLNMPLKSGLECLKEIKADPKLKDVTVAIYSTSTSPEDVENTFVSGANVYIRKPSEYSGLVKILNDIVLINWQYIIGGLNKDNFIMKL